MSELPTYPAGRRVAPSILSADFARLGEQVDEVLDAGAEVIHVDVMDGDFVPPITIGPLIVSAIADQVHAAGAVVDCHLMIRRPELQVDEFARAGADSITVHAEATPHLDRVVGAIHEAGCRAGAAINPGTPVIALGEVAGSCDLLLCMSVNPGWGGQSFIAGSPEKVRAHRRARLRCGDRDRRGDRRRHRAARGGRRNELVRRRIGDLRDRRPGRRLSGDRGGALGT